MGVKNFLKKKLQKEVIKPVYVPILEGNILQERTVIITGGGSGIGLAIAQACVKNGANVVITGRNNQKLNSSVKELEKSTKKWEINLFIVKFWI